ncbi:class I SAM-dependent methyltransferase [Saccharothrix sp. S26]|uniref:class I SAM-dependent methyltransferase n=1 Tax=Saccharothrix sp. S26 TaxID=2907215 RepID=UPI001F29107C|nr:class I SAM-dependent methyltransferase [Saccharothrix sp. S26]MCE6998071.1 class I SAM-dependent methyltransferase [Saccharothrix sp. S26]
MTTTAPDGSPVEVYALLPALGEAEVVHDALPPGADVLDLGCGTGRVAHRLVELGHPVVGVDESAEMLAHLDGVEAVRARIGELRLGRRFGGVLLAAHLVNSPSDGGRHALLASAARHLGDDGRLVVQWHPPSWFDTAADGQGGAIGPVRTSLRDVRRDGDLLSATVDYRTADRTWSHPFTARRLSEDDLDAALHAAGLVRDAWLTPDRTWFAARGQSSKSSSSRAR